MDTALITRSPMQVKTADTDLYRRLRSGGMMTMMIQSAIDSAESMGFGMEYMHDHDLFWALSRIAVRLYRPVVWNEHVTVETWPKDIRGLAYLRDFTIRDGKDKIVAAATSSWLCVNRQTKRPGHLHGNSMDIFTRLKDHHAGAGEAVKLDAVNEAESRKRLINPVYFDFDINQHVTTTRYVDWMMDIPDIHFHRDLYTSEMQINFIHEILPGEEITIHYIQRERELICEGRKPDMPAFRGHFRFSPV